MAALNTVLTQDAAEQIAREVCNICENDPDIVADDRIDDCIDAEVAEFIHVVPYGQYIDADKLTRAVTRLLSDLREDDGE